MTSNSRYSMLDSMDIRCTRCGYENNPQFRFCGMCGAALRPRDPEQREDSLKSKKSEGEIISQRLMENAPPPPEPMPVEPLIAELTAAQTRQADSERNYSDEAREESRPSEPFHATATHGERTPLPVTGLSFLGLSEGADDHRVEYLLEDEPHPGRAGKLVGFLLLLVICASGLYFWRRAGYPWPSHVTTATDRSGQVSVPAPSEGAPSTDSRQVAEQSKTGVGDESLPTVGSNSTAPRNESSPPENNKHKNDDNDEQSSADAKAAGKESLEAKETPDRTEEPESAPTPPAHKPAATRSLTISKPNLPKSSPATAGAVNPAEDSLYLQGQKFLYGTGGVPANCARAEQYLMSSANNNNSKAETTLGTMYATGHCVRRDLPLAYRWFARALREDPRNTRLERDVQMMWDEMSPQERALALKNQ